MDSAEENTLIFFISSVGKVNEWDGSNKMYLWLKHVMLKNKGLYAQIQFRSFFRTYSLC